MRQKAGEEPWNKSKFNRSKEHIIWEQPSQLANMVVVLVTVQTVMSVTKTMQASIGGRNGWTSGALAHLCKQKSYRR